MDVEDNKILWLVMVKRIRNRYLYQLADGLLIGIDCIKYHIGNIENWAISNRYIGSILEWLRNKFI